MYLMCLYLFIGLILSILCIVTNHKEIKSFFTGLMIILFFDFLWLPILVIVLLIYYILKMNMDAFD
jgi:ABC-type protease/lipase transport system fused ATPase/permease subunit